MLRAWSAAERARWRVDEYHAQPASRNRLGGLLHRRHVLLVASCGSGAEGDDMSDPRVVARAYTAAAFECGERGAGKRYDLSTSPNRDWSRDTYLDLQRKAGCKPHPAPDLQVALIQQRADFAAVEVVAKPTDASQKYRPARLLHIRVDGHGKWTRPAAMSLRSGRDLAGAGARLAAAIARDHPTAFTPGTTADATHRPRRFLALSTTL
jgi:hypothetical protein